MSSAAATVDSTHTQTGMEGESRRASLRRVATSSHNRDLRGANDQHETASSSNVPAHSSTHHHRDQEQSVVESVLASRQQQQQQETVSVPINPRADVSNNSASIELSQQRHDATEAADNSSMTTRRDEGFVQQPSRLDDHGSNGRGLVESPPPSSELNNPLPSRSSLQQQQQQQQQQQDEMAGGERHLEPSSRADAHFDTDDSRERLPLSISADENIAARLISEQQPRDLNALSLSLLSREAASAALPSSVDGDMLLRRRILLNRLTTPADYLDPAAAASVAAASQRNQLLLGSELSGSTLLPHSLRRILPGTNPHLAAAASQSQLLLEQHAQQRLLAQQHQHQHLLAATTQLHRQQLQQEQQQRQLLLLHGSAAAGMGDALSLYSATTSPLSLQALTQRDRELSAATAAGGRGFSHLSSPESILGRQRGAVALQNQSMLLHLEQQERQHALRVAQLSTPGVRAASAFLPTAVDRHSFAFDQQRRLLPDHSQHDPQRATRDPPDADRQNSNDILSAETRQVLQGIHVPESFPVKLHRVLSELEKMPSGCDVASFLPHGRAFCIHDPAAFAGGIMKKYFRMNRFASFQRQLNLYNFQRIQKGRDKGAYHHRYFLKDKPNLSKRMRRTKIKGENSIRKQQSEGTQVEIDFYSMPPINSDDEPPSEDDDAEDSDANANFEQQRADEQTSAAGQPE